MVSAVIPDVAWNTGVVRRQGSERRAGPEVQDLEPVVDLLNADVAGRVDVFSAVVDPRRREHGDRRVGVQVGRHVGNHVDVGVGNEAQLAAGAQFDDRQVGDVGSRL